jgi:hypothetical protein
MSVLETSGDETSIIMGGALAAIGNTNMRKKYLGITYESRSDKDRT